jgi:hypothetical protein
MTGVKRPEWRIAATREAKWKNYRGTGSPFVRPEANA